jgi:phage repressor protein C with HTH and peptisase S24 domain
MEWAEKIRCIENELGIANERGRLARLLGVRPGRISEIRNGKSKNPGADIPLLLIDLLGVNPKWLKKEELPILIKDQVWIKNQIGIIEYFAKEELKKQLNDAKILHKKAEKTASPETPAEPPPREEGPPGIPLISEGDGELADGIVIPLLENAASAGYGADLGDDDVPVRYIRVPRFLSKYPHLASLPVKGDSMEPTLHDGDLVVCDGGGWDGDGIYVLKTYDTAYVKRVVLTPKGYQVVSDNKMYPGYTGDAEEVSIVGKVRAILAMVPGRRGGV